MAAFSEDAARLSWEQFIVPQHVRAAFRKFLQCRTKALMKQYRIFPPGISGPGLRSVHAIFPALIFPSEDLLEIRFHSDRGKRIPINANKQSA